MMLFSTIFLFFTGGNLVAVFFSYVGQLVVGNVGHGRFCRFFRTIYQRAFGDPERLNIKSERPIQVCPVLPLMDKSLLHKAFTHLC
jgi:hypothetical protein